MADFIFCIPSKLRDLLVDNGDYFVRNVVVPRDIQSEFKAGKAAFAENGPEWILHNFDIYYSILYHENTVSLDVVYKSYLQLHTAVKSVSNCLCFLLEDKSSITEQVQQKYRNVLKMLIYIYVETILFVEQANVTSAKNRGLTKGRQTSKSDHTDAFNLDKNSILVSLNNILQLEVALFWDPPVVEEHFINLIAEVCYKFLENPQIKADKVVREAVFSLMGCLMKSYNHSTTFAIRMTQMIKDQEHLIQCLTEGTKFLVETHNCKGLIHALIQEVTEWQTDDTFQDSQGSKFCGQFISSLAVSMPDYMVPELEYLNAFLGHDPVALRNSVLNVMTEIILNAQLKLDINNDRIIINELFTILMEHIRDKSAHVRTRVMQHFARLQTEGAIPLPLVNDILENIVKYHLHDKAALVRKSAVSCVTAFLTHNGYGSKLSLKMVTKDLESTRELLDQLQPQVDQVKSLKAKELEAEWIKMVPELKQFLLELLEKEDEAEANYPEKETCEEDAADLIRMYIDAGKYKEALQIWKRSVNIGDMSENPDSDKILEEFLSHLQSIYQSIEILSSVKNGVVNAGTIITEEDFNKFLSLRARSDYLTREVEFLKLMDDAVDLAVALLETTCISDMQEAVAFFIAAYQFEIDNAQVGVTAMLKMMRCNEQNRKDLVIDAFKNMYLKTDASNMKDHSMTIVNRLIGLFQWVSADEMENFELIISEWVHQGVIDNNVIDMLWQYFTKKVDVSDEHSRASVELLRMAAIKRRTVISRNIKLVASVAFAERGRQDLAFLGSACNFLAVAGRDRIDITSSDPPFSVSSEDTIFSDLFTILSDTFFTPQEFYYQALAGALEFVYKLCGRPHILCEQFIKQIMNALMPRITDEGIEEFIYIRVCQLVGLVALKHLNYLDETVYKELKRRANFHSSKQNKKEMVKKSRQSAAASRKAANNTASHGEESVMEGAQAEDQDAEFILHILEKNTVTGQGVLSQLVHLVLRVCSNVGVYDNNLLQGSAVIALIRCMLVSSEFCQQHVQLLFTIFEKSRHLDVKKCILLHMPDLLSRFPNVIEPWMHRIFNGLKSPEVEIRRAAFYSLSCLILQDMIMAHSHIHLMVDSLVDPDEELSGMCRTFFIRLSQKENNLYNILPDIFSHLLGSDGISEDNCKYIMKFLFELMDKCKHMGNLVHGFCLKFRETDNVNHQRQIAYCLTLVVYNDKTLAKLLNDFPLYKNLMQDSEIYSCFKTIIQGCSKQGKAELKPILEELEKSIASLFEVGCEGQMPAPSTSHVHRKKPNSRRKQKH